MKRSILLIACAAALAAASSGGERYLWPLDAERKLSSSFQEYRDGHYHAGIDLRTFGQLGLPCRAIDDGEAVRLRVQPAGYGKALYVRLRDGRTAVYAHLNGFTRALDSLAYHWRLERGRNSCDIELPPGAHAFKRGDIVAYTGSSGSQHPHLHFEMRESDGRPVNPLESFYRIPDDCPPILTGFSVVPLVWGSLVDGSPVALTARFHLVTDSRYAVADTFVLDGEFGFGVSAYDKQTRGSYRMGPYSTELFIDGKRAYRVRASRFDYARYADVAIEYEERGGALPGRYLALFEKPANAMPDREGPGAVSNIGLRPGAAVLEPGLHGGEIVVSDVNGNEARGTFHFIVRAAGEASPAVRGAVASGSGGASGAQGAPASGNAGPEVDSVRCEVLHEIRAEGLYLRIKTTVPLAGAPSVSLLGDTTRSALRVLPLGPREHAILVPPERFSGTSATFRIRGMDAAGRAFERFRSYRMAALRTGSRIDFTAGESLGAWIEAPSARGAGLVLIRNVSASDGAPAGLERLAPPFSIEYAQESFASYLVCGFDAGRRAGLYRKDNAEGWRCVGVPAAGAAAVEIRRPGTYAIMNDAKAPAPRSPVFTRHSPESGYFKKKLHYVPVYEHGSGVDAESARAYLDGRRIVCEWDGYRERLLVPIPRSHPPGTSRLRVEVSDRAGNSGSAEYTIVIE